MLAIMLLLNAIVEQFALGVIMIFTAISFGAGYCITRLKKQHEIKSQLCKYCDNVATIISYRERDGQVSKEITCHRCHELTNEGLKAIDKLINGEVEIGGDYPAVNGKEEIKYKLDKDE